MVSCADRVARAFGLGSRAESEDPASAKRFYPPPSHLLPRIGSAGVETFVAEGFSLKECVRRCLPIDVPLSPGSRVLDFGCGVGRLLWHLQDESDNVDFVGCDIDERSIAWVRERFGAQFRVFVNDDRPPLPLEGDSIDLVVSLSVFTHIPDYWAEWLLELRRILKPNGAALLSYQGAQMYQESLGDPEDLRSAGFVVDGRDNTWDQGGPQVYQSDEWIQSNWSTPGLAVEAVFPGGLGGAQSAAVLRKRGDDRYRPPHVAQPFTQHVGPRGGWRYFVEYDSFAPESWWAHAGCPTDRALFGWVASAHAPVAAVVATAGGREVPIVRSRREDVASTYGLAASHCAGYEIAPEVLREHGGEVVRVTGTDEMGSALRVEFQVAATAPK